MKKMPILGMADSGPLQIDIPRLLQTRMLIQSSSGGGKSWALRRILEQTVGHVQQVILDIEGEFPTLREKFDYIICAPNGADAIATPQTATILARRLRETRVSAIIDMYELKMPERKRFVRLFLEEFVEAPKSMWHPCLVVVDEAHHFAPQKDEAESLGAVNDLITRGRKRGLAGLLATQRLAKLNKDSAAELHNKLIGLAVLDDDVKRAAEDLGLTAKEAFPLLRNLNPGEFYCFGPALIRTVTKIKVGKVSTTHPQAGIGASTKPPEPSEKIKALLAKLTDLPKEAEQEARTTAELKRENAQLKRELTLVKKAVPSIAVAKISRIEVPVVGKRAANSIAKSCAAIKKLSTRTLETHKASCDALTMILKDVEKLTQQLDRIENTNQVQGTTPISAPTNRPIHTSIIKPAYETPRIGGNGASNTINAAARKILAVLAQFPDGCTSGKLTLLTGYRYSGGFKNSLSELRTAGLITGTNNSVMRITESGLALGPFEPLPQGRALVDYWLNHRSFGQCERRILATLLNSPEGLSASELCDRAGYSYSGGFKNSLSNLRTAGVLLGANTTRMSANSELLNVL